MLLFYELVAVFSGLLGEPLHICLRLYFQRLRKIYHISRDESLRIMKEIEKTIGKMESLFFSRISPIFDPYLWNIFRIDVICFNNSYQIFYVLQFPFAVIVPGSASHTVKFHTTEVLSL